MTVHGAPGDLAPPVAAGEPAPGTTARPGLVSFIVPAHDEARLIGATLDALHEAARGLVADHEIVVVDDASTDDTARIARQHGARVVQVAHRHIAATRNSGAQVACGDRLVFVDADTLVNPAVLEAAMAAMDKGSIGGGAAVRLQGRVRWHERFAVALFVWIFRLTRIAPGCFVFCTREAFDATGGFDQAYYAAEDIAMSRALARQGRFTILRQPVHTSARKLRTHGLFEHMRLLWRLARHRRGMLTSREHLDLWYGQRRRDED